MDDPVARGHIGDGDRCVVDHDVVANAEGQGLTVHRSSGHAVGDIRRKDIGRDDVVQQNVGKCRFPFRRVQTRKVNACVCKCLVGGGKHRERALTLKRFQQVSLHHCSHQ